MKKILDVARTFKRYLVRKRYEFVCKYCSVEKASKVRYKMLMRRPLNLKEPKTLNEKLQWLKLNTYRDNKLVSLCSDKYAVRDYVKKHIDEKYLVKLYGVYDKAEDIDFEALPDSFVLKCNHGSGSVICCKNKAELDIAEAREKLNRWLREDYSKTHAELSYTGIERKIICEEFIQTEDGKPPKDYKIFCSYGVPKFLYIASERNGMKTKFDFYDLDWNWMPVKNGHPNAGDVLKKPDNFDEMLAVAGELSKPFPLVRVDLYNESGKIIFGELTFLHASGCAAFEPDEYDRKFGDYFPEVYDCKMKI